MEESFLNIMYDKVSQHLHNYDLCLVSRIDLYIKDYFIKNVIFDEIIRFPYIDSNLSVEKSNESLFFPVCHTIVYYPKKFFLLYIIKLYTTQHIAYIII